MPRINSRSKGASGEREFCNWLERNLQIDFKPERNLEQVRSGGADILNCYPFLFEIKRVENLDLMAAWLQVKAAWLRFAKEDVGDSTIADANLIPVVAFRKNRQPWEFLIPACILELDYGYLRLTEVVFRDFAEKQLRQYQKTGRTCMTGASWD